MDRVFQHGTRFWWTKFLLREKKIYIFQINVSNYVKKNLLTISDVDVVASFMSDIGLKLADKIHTHRETTKCAFISTEESEDHPAQASRHATKLTFFAFSFIVFCFSSHFCLV